MGELHVLPRSISIAVDQSIPENLSKVYGDEDPVIAYQLAEGALVPGDVLSGELIRTQGENVGSYSIDLGSVKAGNPNDPFENEYYGLNYSISLIGEPEFSITSKALTIVADNQTKTYGEPDPSLTYVTTGLANGDTESIITGALERVDGENAGDYLILQGSLNASSNYSIAFTTGTFSILKAQLDMIVNNAVIYAGDPLPGFTYSVNGFRNGDTEFDVFESEASFTVNGDYGNPGNYEIIPVPRLLIYPLGVFNHTPAF